MNWISFTHPWILAGAVAVGLPILIHYLTRARPRRIAFPPFQFLLEACAGQQAVHRLRTIILLTIRCLAVLALVLLFSRPFVKPKGPGAASQAHRRVVLVLDGSLSMRAVQRGMPLFARAKAEAADVLRALDSGSEAAVIIAGAAPKPLLPALSQNLAALHEALVQAEATFEHADMAAALVEAQRILNGAGEAYIFSDFQQSNWEPAQQMPAGVTCRLRPVTTEPIANVGIIGARVSPAEPVVSEPAEVVCTIFNGAPGPRQETVRLELGDATREMRVSVPAFGTAEAVFNLNFPQAGVVTGKASLPPDDLREDDIRYLAVRVHNAVQLLVISDADAEDQRSAAFFVNRALVPSAQAVPGLSLVPRHSQDTDRGILETADGFVIVTPAMLTGEAAEIMARRVSEGVQLLVLLDGPNAQLLMPATFHPPFQLLRVVTSDAGEPVVPGPYKLMADSDPTDWAALRFRRHYQNQILDGRANEVILAYLDGSAALTLTKVGKGSVVFANIPLTPDGGDFIGNPMFPVILHELLRAVRRGTEGQAVTPGSAWTLDAPGGSDGTVRVSDPNGQLVEAQPIASGRITQLAMPIARSPGVYLVKQGEKVVGAGVVNVDPRESDPRPIALEKLKSGPGAAVTILSGEEDLVISGNTRPLWPLFAAIVLAALSLEMILLALWRPARGITATQIETAPNFSTKQEDLVSARAVEEMEAGR